MVWLRPIRSVCIREKVVGLGFGQFNALNDFPLVFSVK